MSKERIHIDQIISKQALAYAIAGVFLLIFAITFAIVAYTPVRNLIPGYPSARTRELQVENAIRIDSLERCIMRWEFYTGNLRNVLEGREPVKLDSLIHRFNAEYNTKQAGDLAKVDSSLRSQVQDVEKYELSSGKRHLPIESKHFFKPVNGAILQGFELVTHPCVEISVPGGTSVKAVLDGSIVFTGWNSGDGWCVVIQHEDNLLSVYRHVHDIFKQTGDQVNAGMVLGLCGRNGKGTGSSQVDDKPFSFELWQNGTPADPEEYIKF